MSGGAEAASEGDGCRVEDREESRVGYQGTTHRLNTARLVSDLSKTSWSFLYLDRPIQFGLKVVKQMQEAFFRSTFGRVRLPESPTADIVQHPSLRSLLHFTHEQHS